MTRHRDQAAIRIRNRYAALHVARLDPGESVTIPDAPFAHVYLARGRMDLEAEGALEAGDAARLTAAGARRLAAAEPSEVLIWEMHASCARKERGDSVERTIPGRPGRDHRGRDRRPDGRPVLQQFGVRVRVFEQARALREIGAGVTVTPNAMSALEFLGLGSALAEQAGETPRYFVRSSADGRELERGPDPDSGSAPLTAICIAATCTRV